MDKKQEQQIVGYYSTAGRYIRSGQYSDHNQTVFTKEGNNNQWLVLEQKNQSEVEVRQIDRHGTITARDYYEIAKNLSRCVSVERFCESGKSFLSFNVDEINLIYQFGGQSKAETCAMLAAILPKIGHQETAQIVKNTLNKLNALSEEVCSELTATTQKRKLAERDFSITERLAKAREEQKQQTSGASGEKRHKTEKRNGRSDIQR